MNQAKNVSVGKPRTAGSAWRAPLGTPLPTGAADKLDAAFEGLGYLSEDGLVNANSPESDSIKAWGGDTVFSYQKSRPDKFTFTMIEALNPSVLKAAYGDSQVTGELETGLTVTANSDQHEASSWVFEMLLRGGILKRVVLPSASVAELGEITYKDDTAIGYKLTLSAEPDENGNTHYEYMVRGGAAAETGSGEPQEPDGTEEEKA